jgi:hypothetical protein
MRSFLPFSRPLAGLAVAAALVVAGCGGSGSSKNDYVKSLNQAQAALQKSLSGLNDLGASSSGKQVAAKLEAGGSAVDDAADNFNKIQPPDDAKHAHGQIVAGLHELAGEFRDAAKDAKSDDLAGAAKTLQAVVDSPGAKQIQAAEDELKANGYKFDDQS